MTLGLRRSETFERNGLGSFMSWFEGLACIEETDKNLDSVRTVWSKVHILTCWLVSLC